MILDWKRGLRSWKTSIRAYIAVRKAKAEVFTRGLEGCKGSLHCAVLVESWSGDWLCNQ